MNLRCFLKLGFFWEFSGFFYDSRDYFQNLTSELAENGTNTKYEVSEMNLRCFLKLGFFWEFSGLF